MATKAIDSKESYQEIFPPSTTRPKFQIDRRHPLHSLWNIIRFSFNNSTWLAIGASLQALIVLLPIPRFFTLTPAIFFLLYRLTWTLLVRFEFLPNPYLKGSIPYRYTTLMPDENGNLPSQEDETPTNQKVAIFLLAATVNHPAGWLAAPHSMEFVKNFQRMNADLHSMPLDQSGCLGHTQLYLHTPVGTTELWNISYWRSKEHVLRYAESPAHRDGVKWFSDMGAYREEGNKIRHIGIAHELFESAAGNWETIYHGFQPTMMGATSYIRKGDRLEKGDVPDAWITPIVAAKRGKLAFARGRLGEPVGRPHITRMETY